MWITALAVVAGAVICGVGAAIAGLGGWWIFSMVMAGIVGGLTIGSLLAATAEDGEVQQTEQRKAGGRRGRAKRVADDGPLAR